MWNEYSRVFEETIDIRIRGGFTGADGIGESELLPVIGYLFVNDISRYYVRIPVDQAVVGPVEFAELDIFFEEKTGDVRTGDAGYIALCLKCLSEQKKVRKKAK